jgi:two-component system, OmpR family, response regulator VicR
MNHRMEKPPRILLLEDDPNLGTIVHEHLTMHGYEVTLITNGEDGLTVWHSQTFDLCLVDIMMPRRDGFSFAREVRKTDANLPLIFLTAKSLKEDKIEGFTIGCDDYLTKPFSVEELLLRISAVLRRSRGGPAKPDEQTLFQIGKYKFDSRRQLLTYGRTQYKLTPKESDLLRLLCLHMNDTLDRDTALREIWQSDSYFSGRSMDVFVSKLRKYFKDDKRIEILTIHGKGFRLIVG